MENENLEQQNNENENNNENNLEQNNENNNVICTDKIVRYLYAYCDTIQPIAEELKEFNSFMNCEIELETDELESIISIANKLNDVNKELFDFVKKIEKKEQ